MAGWSILANGSDLDLAGNVSGHGNKSVGGDNDDDYDNHNGESDGSDVRLRGLFDEVLSHFLKAIGEKGLFRPFPAMLDCEKPVDLFRLFCVVRKRGGYGSVSKRRLWGFVAKEMGVRIRGSASAKLVYFKYLSELEQWLVDREKFEVDGNFRLLSPELEAEFRDLFSEFGLARFDNDEKMGDDRDRCVDGGGGGGGGGDLAVLNSSADDEKGKDCKRKRESLSGMVKWLAEKAKLLGDQSNEEIGLKEEELDGKELFAQAMRAREVLLLRRHVNPKDGECISQKKMKMHPSLYEDTVVRNHQSTERLRCSKRLPIVAKSRLCSCCNSCPPVPSKPINSPKVEPESEPDEPTAEVDLSAMVTEVCPSEDESAEKHVSVGPLFQADVPEWTGVVSESDPKWLGTRVWPLDCRENDYSTAKVGAIAKGRPKFCGCSFPGSGECVRFHIAEARMKLKLELGSVFFSWKFDRMGEEFSLRWTAEEEKRFKDVIRSNKSFWDKKIKWFLRKTRENLVSYYFNVFVIQKRSYQNRVTPKNIDSDDDEAEFGSIGGHFGNSLTDLSVSNSLPCVQNRQCTDLEETNCSSKA